MHRHGEFIKCIANNLTMISALFAPQQQVRCRLLLLFVAPTMLQDTFLSSLKYHQFSWLPKSIIIY